MKNTIKIFLLTVIFQLMITGTAMAKEMDYVIEKGRTVIIPKTYEVKNVIYDLGEKWGILKQAEDLFIDSGGYLYVADTGNNRVIKMSLKGEVLAVFSGEADNPLKEPKGVYVDDDGDLFIADTGNSRILHLSPDGRFVEEFVKPNSELLDDSFTFQPDKVYINTTGYIYIIKSQSFMSIDAYNRFRGFTGATEVGFDFVSTIIRMFASVEQKNRLIKRLPDSYSNFLIAEDGIIYATVVNAEKDQIRKINSIGNNIYKKNTHYGHRTVNQQTMESELPYFIDLSVDKDGIISALDQKSGKVYQYDNEGNLLTVFGGFGNWKGVFSKASSIVTDEEGRLYILDLNMNNIQVFEPTRFIKLVHKAVTSYSQGEYDDALRLWEDILDIDANYSLAHTGIGNILFKQERYKEALYEYQMSEDKDGYSKAFKEFRLESLRNNFTLIVLIAAALIVGILLFIKWLKLKADKYNEGCYKNVYY